MVTLYGIKNCDTIKKARRWLEANNIDYRFHSESSLQSCRVTADCPSRFYGSALRLSSCQWPRGWWLITPR
ncbi:hypothetical protein PZH30_22845, partial [Escherichia coli]|nr:hypothetical protein [Escherichia coli]